jgi:hypothetical protein
MGGVQLGEEEPSSQNKLQLISLVYVYVSYTRERWIRISIQNKIVIELVFFFYRNEDE